MEWRVDGSRHKLHRPPSSCRRFPIQQARCRERDLWGTLTILSLFAEIVMANSETLRAASGSLGSVNSASMENNSMETPFLATWNHQHGKNVAMQDLSTSELLGTSHSPSHSRNARRNSRRSGKGPCRLHSRALNVQDLGLGYKTEEVVLFKYCSGSCDSYRTNYDQVMNYITQQGLVPVEKNFMSKPCCRPVLFENFSFLDIYNVWQNVEKGSAAACGCVG
ncbi:artemin [Notechis scutatus]|uniref:Artemin n=1 Tax=Notechis scutatus TaxID=8663 RepID=A0A6J1U0Z3_9SAUR|nr:artemin [Notechis scutatus]XP_026521512.1 artemin [Notechis scutatus]XP_026521514.1 artemin [Notechis scutatus]